MIMSIVAMGISTLFDSLYCDLYSQLCVEELSPHRSWKSLWPFLDGCNPPSVTKANIKISQTALDRTGQLCASLWYTPPSSDVVKWNSAEMPTVHHEMTMKSHLYNKWTMVLKWGFKIYFSSFFQNFSPLSFFVSQFSYCQWNEILYLPYSPKALQISVWV